MGFKGARSRCYELGSCGRCDPEEALKRMRGEGSYPGRASAGIQRASRNRGRPGQTRPARAKVG
jgi:hypothetical protein